MVRDPMGVRMWRTNSLYRGFEGEDSGQRLGLSDSRFAPCHTDTSEFLLQTSSGAAQSSHDASSSCTNVDATDVALSSYFMDGSVRAIFKKVTVNEGVLNETIESFGGGEKGLKELLAYIMSWVREHKDKSSETLSLSQGLENLRKAPPPSGYGASEAAKDLHQISQPCTISRHLNGGAVDRSDAYRGTFVDVNGSVPYENQFPKLNTSSGSSDYIGPAMFQQQEMYHPQQMVNPPLGFVSFAPGHDELSRTLAATTTRAARRNRIARQRQQSLSRTGSTAGASWSPSPSLSTLDLRGAGMSLQGAPQASVVPARKANNSDMLTFLLQKELRPSDVSNLGRIILPKKEAEMYLPILTLREGLVLQMEDYDSGVYWNIRYRFWPNNKSRMYLLENTGELVKKQHLQEGDLLILYRNHQGNYVLRGKKKMLSESRRGAQGSQQKYAHSLARGFPEASKSEGVLKEKDFGLGNRSYQKVVKEGDFEWEFDDRKALKAEPTVLVGYDDPFFKEDVMHNIGCSFGPALLQPLERFPSLNLDFPFDEIMASIPKDDTEMEPNLGSSIVVPKAEPA